MAEAQISDGQGQGRERETKAVRRSLQREPQCTKRGGNAEDP
jgi:hypothetical protein